MVERQPRIILLRVVIPRPDLSGFVIFARHALVPLLLPLTLLLILLLILLRHHHRGCFSGLFPQAAICLGADTRISRFKQG